jgi:hypothetical protein
MQEVTIAEVAKCLGKSTDSIRRRIAKGELKARKVPSPHGEIYLIELPDSATVTSSVSEDKEDNPLAVEAMRKTISILETELEARRREVQELHVLLQQAQKQLPPGKSEVTTGEAPKKVSWWRQLITRKKHQ